MLMSPFRRPGRLRRTWLRLTSLLLLIMLFVDLFFSIIVHSPPEQISASTTFPTNLSATKNDRIFIASMHWNNEVAIRSHWSTAVLGLVMHFGAENVYVSIIESGSWDGSKDALRELDSHLGNLGVQRNIELLDTTHKDEIEHTPGPYEEGWVWTSRGRKELRRIPYLAGIRNRVMEKLTQLADNSTGQKEQKFDKILWLNDVVFTTEDVTNLIATRNGNYAAACSLDFSNPPSYYDTFALRDISGAKAITQTWPYFLAAKSRNALISNSPVPVKSCWNGMAVFQADPFYSSPPLRFRGIPDSLAAHHLEGSECCLIHMDNELSAKQGVWLNPNVRVTYNAEAYKAVNPDTGLWPTRMERVQGIWRNRLARWSGLPRRCLERYMIEKRLRLWRDTVQLEGQDELHDDEHYCMINEMQVLIENGWAHV